jgi:hypothetical protein
MFDLSSMPSNNPDDIRTFGVQLIRTGDLDPVYVGLHKARLPIAQLERALLAYWCFYSLGFAAWVSEAEGKEYWDRMSRAAANTTPSHLGTRWPRATERRHFRGGKCVQTVDWLSQQEPEYWVRSLLDAKTEKEVMNRVCMWPLFGPWIAFKAADMLERVYGLPLQFDPNIGLLYDSPREALDTLSADETFITTDHSIPDLYQNLLRFFSSHRAPPDYGRYCNAQEVETILCKWGSMKSGHYWVGRDITEVRHALMGWGKTAERIIYAMPPEV